jgi:hypothetical protein
LDVWTLCVRLRPEDRRRDLALFNLAIDCKPRGCDLVRLHIDDLCAGSRVRDRTTVIQKKSRQTGSVRNYRANLSRDWRVAVLPRCPERTMPLSEPRELSAMLSSRSGGGDAMGKPCCGRSGVHGTASLRISSAGHGCGSTSPSAGTRARSAGYSDRRRTRRRNVVCRDGGNSTWCPDALLRDDRSNKLSPPRVA